jgi:hypothetical protein
MGDVEVSERAKAAATVEDRGRRADTSSPMAANYRDRWGDHKQGHRRADADERTEASRADRRGDIAGLMRSQRASTK